MLSYQFANITVRPFVGINDVRNPYIFKDGTHIINVCLDWREEVKLYVEQHNGSYDWLPLNEMPNMNIDNLLKAVTLLAQFDRFGQPVIVHCVGGNNRSRTVVEAYHFAKLGTHYTDEYKGFQNHLVYNCESGYLPPLKEMEQLLSSNLEKILYTRKTQVEVSLRQGEMHLYGSAPKEYVDKMSEIVNRDPEGTWTNRVLELLTEAIKELENNSL